MVKVILLGPMGAGKSTLGKILSHDLQWPYFDNDVEITTTYGLSEKEVSQLPVEKLHALETQYLRDVLSRPESFISGAAASVIDNEENRLLLDSVFSVYLRLPIEMIIERAGSSGVGRQVLQDAGTDILIERFNRRDPLYRAASRLVVELSDSPMKDAEVIKRAVLS
jgi:shikimate kinase